MILLNRLTKLLTRFGRELSIKFRNNFANLIQISILDAETGNLLLGILLHDFVQVHALNKRPRLNVLTRRKLHFGEKYLELSTNIFFWRLKVRGSVLID